MGHLFIVPVLFQDITGISLIIIKDNTAKFMVERFSDLNLKLVSNFKLKCIRNYKLKCDYRHSILW